MVMDFELRHLRYFVALAEEQHFSRAAERLGIAQPPLSQQIQRLEELIGHRLFERKPRVRLTPAGEALLPLARRTLAQAAEAAAAAVRAAEGRIGSLTVGFPASALLSVVPGAVRLFRERWPEVDLHLREMSSAAQVAGLAEGAIDIGFLRQPPTHLPELVCRRVLHEPFSAVVAKGHRLDGRATIRLEDLAHEDFILFPRSVAPGLYDQVHALCRGAGFAPRVMQEAQEWITIVGLVEAGAGLSIVPASFQRLRWGGVHYLPLTGDDVRTEIWLCRPAGDVRPTVARFMELVPEV